MSDVTPIDVTEYHEQTKHRFTSLARGPDTLDWDAQPAAFRHFEGAELFPLPLTSERFTLPFSALFDDTAIPSQPLTIDSIGLLLEISMAVSAWKQYGSARWALRCNPSSGNLHPTEAYLIPQGLEGLEDGVYHYRADDHALEQRCRFTLSTQEETPGLLLGLSSIHWREAWKYGERAYRYCQLDVGHAIAAISYAAATLGWEVTPHYEVGDKQLADLLGIHRDDDYPKGSEQEHPDLLISLHPAGTAPASYETLLSRQDEATWFGRANVLDRRHFYHWPIIDDVSQAAERIPPISPAMAEHERHTAEPLPSDTDIPAATLFRRRRSAQAFDGQSGMTREAFFRTLDHLLPRNGTAPWDTQPWSARVHPVLFVHRVEGLEPGIYVLPRREGAASLMQSHMNQEFAWTKVESAPEHLPLYHLIAGKVEGTAMKLSCGQSIAGNSAFSLAMLAEFEENVSESPWRYRELHWEAGAIGQVLYLEAEASDLQGTGIGCFFDNGVHELLGISGHKLQVVYHFTVGKALTDDRITTLPAYDR